MRGVGNELARHKSASASSSPSPGCSLFMCKGWEWGGDAVTVATAAAGIWGGGGWVREWLGPSRAGGVCVAVGGRGLPSAEAVSLVGKKRRMRVEAFA